MAYLTKLISRVFWYETTHSDATCSDGGNCALKKGLFAWEIEVLMAFCLE